MIVRTYKELSNELATRVATNIPELSAALTPGSFVRGILDEVAMSISDTYQYLNDTINNTYISQATGGYIDLIAGLFNITRIPGETDNDLKYRITNNLRSKENCNETAIRLGCLNVNNVADIKLIKYPYGIGSFQVYVIVQDDTNASQALSDVQDILNRTMAAGIRAEALLPNEIVVDMQLDITLNKSSNTMDFTTISKTVETNIRNYLLNLDMGQQLIYNRLIQVIMDSSIYIVNTNIKTMSIDNKAVLLRDYYPKWNQKLKPNTITISRV